MNPEDVIVVGALRTIAYARDALGHAHARTFLEDVCPHSDLDRLQRWFQLIADQGERGTNQKAFKHEAGAIHAFKGHRARVAAFRVGRTWFLTNGFLKQRDRWPPEQLRRASRIRLEHLSREGTE
jgi:hypothetical protein